MMFAYANRREDEKNIWRLLFLAFIGAVLRQLIEKKPPPPPREDFDGNAYGDNPYPPKPPTPDYGQFDELFQKAIETVRQTQKTKVG